MIKIKRSVYNEIIAHAKLELPNEACGYLAGTDNDVVLSYRLTNIDHSPEHFSFDPAEQFRALKDARGNGLQIIANYHSHPLTPARPSVEDIRLAYDPEIGYVIISLAVETPDVKAFRIVNGIVEHEEIEITE
jgi:[CysO sulfur-carrier protein]-S-L-cysteine hydrolase